MKRPSILRSITLLILLCGFGVALSGCLSPRPTATPTLPPRQASPATAASAALRPTVAAPDYWPTQGWRTSSPAEQGMDAAKLDQMLEAVKAQNLNLYSLLVIRNGAIVSENYFGATRSEHATRTILLHQELHRHTGGHRHRQRRHRRGRTAGCQLLSQPRFRER